MILEGCSLMTCNVVMGDCEYCGRGWSRCSSHGWRYRCRCQEEEERAYEAMEAEYNQQIQEEYERDVLCFDRLAMGM